MPLLVLQTLHANDNTMYLLDFLHLLELLTFIFSTLHSTIGLSFPVSNQRYCRPMPDEQLRQRLGESFDARYMSMADPRKANSAPIGAQLASLDFSDDFGGMRRHRRRHWKEPWTCDTVPEVIDLGIDHYPRYLNSKKCTSDRCFFGTYYCRPRTYAVNVLRRLPGTCIELSPDNTELLPYDIVDRDEPVVVEAWEFVKYAVVVFCECKVFPDRFPSR